jgi:hypothetical protein
MKTKFNLRLVGLLFFLTYHCLSTFAQQSATVGVVSNGKGVITNSAEATKALKGGLSATAIVTNLRIEWVGGDENKFYLIGNISGDKVTAKGIGLTQDGIQLRAAPGPGFEVTCIGVNCTRCDLRIVEWKLQCVCERSGPGPEEGYCNMTVKMVVQPW